MTTTTSLPTYTPALDPLQTEAAVAWLKPFFAQALASELDLQHVCAPVIAERGTGINDDLNGIEQPVRFSLPGDSFAQAEVVQSLAKWKRHRLHTLGIPEGSGLYTDMRALRPDEAPGPLHSIYVDQWDWEKHISPSDRTRSFLEETVKGIYRAIRKTEAALAEQFPDLKPVLPEEVTFVHAEELCKRFPDLSPKEREAEAAREDGAVFVIGIGGALSDGAPHDGRAPDYDDWTSKAEDGQSGLNGDLILWQDDASRAVEISSMGIRVDAPTLERQLEIAGCAERSKLLFHRLLLDGTLPQSIGGGIGQSRLCLYLLRKQHVGEVQVSLWPEAERRRCAEAGIPLMQ